MIELPGGIIIGDGAIELLDPETHDQWLALRRQLGIGASESPAVMGTANPRYASALSVYCDKIGLIERTEDTACAEFGREVEPFLLNYFVMKLRKNLTHNRKIHRSTTYPWMFCTPDAFDRDGIEHQVKVTTRGEWGTDDEPKLPEYVDDQMQHSMVVLGTRTSFVTAVVAGFGGVVPIVREVEQDIIRQKEIIEATHELWSRVQRRDPPDPDGGEASARALARLYAVDSGDSCMLDEESQSDSDALDKADSELKQLTANKELLRQKLKAAIGARKYGILPAGAGVWSLATVNRRGYTVAPTSYRSLTRVATNRAKAIAGSHHDDE